MSCMILDSLFLITIAHINKHGKLPSNVCISRAGFVRRYHPCAVLTLACKVIDIKRPAYTCSTQHAMMILQRAISVIRRKRRRAPFRFYPNSTNKVLGCNMEGVLDLRAGSCNVTGLAYNRLYGVINEVDKSPTPQEGQATLALLRTATLIIVDTDIQCARMQDYLAKRVLLTLCVTGEQASELTLPSVETVWGEPQVDHQ